MSAPAKVIKREFKVHKKLVSDVIKRQAGSVQKAILEGAMNAIDAKATRFDITLSSTGMTLKDNGRGIQTEKELTDVFETFGQPHTAEEQKVYGTFRMGRGQIFSFGKNVWRTGPFEMRVDVQENDDGYDLVGDMPQVVGCTIDVQFYEPLNELELDNTNDSLKDWLAYAQCECYLNGKLLSRLPETEEWNHNTDEAYIRLKTGGPIRVFNLGVHVLDIPGHMYGTGGVVVTKKQVSVNFARNDIQSTCQVWKKIKSSLDQKSRAIREAKITLNDDERMAAINDMVKGRYSGDRKRVPVIPLFTGDYISGKALARRLSLTNNVVTVAPPTDKQKGDRKADRIDQAHKAVVLHAKIWEHLKTTPGDVDALTRFLSWCGCNILYIEYEVLAKDQKNEHTVIPENKWTSVERVWVAAASRLFVQLHDRRSFGRIFGTGDRWTMQHHRRKIIIGDSFGTADGWTDGATYIALDRHFVQKLSFSVGGFTELIALYLHEMSHTQEDADLPDHSIEFYRRYHDLTRDAFPLMLNHLWQRLPYLARSIRAKASLKRNRDRAAEMAIELEKISKELMGLYNSHKLVTDKEKAELEAVNANGVKSTVPDVQQARRKRVRKPGGAAVGVLSDVRHSSETLAETDGETTAHLLPAAKTVEGRRRVLKRAGAVRGVRKRLIPSPA